MDLAIQAMPLPFRFRPQSPMNEDEFLHFCAANRDLRVERNPVGDILVMTPTGFNTSRRNAYLIHALGAWSDADNRGVFFDSNAGFTLPDSSMRSPDAAWIENSRIEALSEEDKDRFSHICPDFIIELRSPSDPLQDLREKMEQWIANGAKLAWLIDPQTRSATIYRPGHAPEVLAEPDKLIGEGPVTGFRLATDRLFL